MAYLNKKTGRVVVDYNIKHPYNTIKLRIDRNNHSEQISLSFVEANLVIEMLQDAIASAQPHIPTIRSSESEEKPHYLDENPQTPLRGYDEYDYPKSLDDVFICKKCGAHKTHYRLRGYRCDSCDNKDE